MKTLRFLTIPAVVAACLMAFSCGCNKTPAAEEVVELQMPGNPFITELYLADPSAHVWSDGRLYVYPSHDVAPPRGCDLMDGYHVFSTTDMVNWTDHGEFLHSRDVAWGRPEGGFMWAPDAAYRNGKYYYYFPHPSGTDWNNTWKVGVGVSDKPTMENLKLLGYLEGLGDAFSMIDPCVFTDDDGQAYFYYGGGGRMIGVKLKDNMTEIDGEPVPMKGPWVFKNNGKYYLMYADNHQEPGLGGRNQLRYCWSDSPLGPWEYKGIILKPTDCDTSHGSIVKYKGQWYLFYHNCNISHMGNLRSWTSSISTKTAPSARSSRPSRNETARRASDPDRYGLCLRAGAVSVFYHLRVLRRARDGGVPGVVQHPRRRGRPELAPLRERPALRAGLVHHRPVAGGGRVSAAVRDGLPLRGRHARVCPVPV